MKKKMNDKVFQTNSTCTLTQPQTDGSLHVEFSWSRRLAAFCLFCGEMMLLVLACETHG